MAPKGFKQRAKQDKSTSTQIPAPFTKAPSSLEPLLQRFDPKLVHITHIDRQPADYKKSIFLIPVLLNTTITALLLWRLYVAVPKYFTLAQTLLGYYTPLTVDTTSTTRKQQIGILLRRTLMFLLDFLLFRFVGPWPLTFFLERPSNPVHYRWKLGFRKDEIIVRVSRGWGTEDLMQGVKQGEENPFFKTRVLPAISREVMGKTGYLMMDKSWDLDFEVMLDSHELVKREDVKSKELDKVVFAFLEGAGWVQWKWEGEGQVDVVEGRRQKVVAFKETLGKMGKESLFWKWTEIVEEERDKDGGFTRERQERVAKRVQMEFEKNGVDFDEVVKSSGGLDEVAPSK
ncbi:uncharacterized protein CLAFUR5_10349 [Fulvia fulva]|uniref:Uncharacterized protein n=1 Tax=Passalora fulva TaxID=5499 RepID=A0A9Q8PCM2_PASFU|nr:uncharacterized protein CLAFUR5_10349 [Fulvia fulva]KAK4620858.1 hypothetical protein CLAFUR0_11320 [Fulvia fulva]UJO20061.1 hypothetical protein CLAFUR5_10349 [Fulvia fulva]